MKQACEEKGGTFSTGWRYNDQGMQWGRLAKCTTAVGYVECQDDICHSTKLERSDVDFRQIASAINTVGVASKK